MACGDVDGHGKECIRLTPGCRHPPTAGARSLLLDRSAAPACAASRRLMTSCVRSRPVSTQTAPELWMSTSMCRPFSLPTCSRTGFSLRWNSTCSSVCSACRSDCASCCRNCISRVSLSISFSSASRAESFMMVALVCCLVLAVFERLFFSVISAIFFFSSSCSLPVAALPSTEFEATAWMSM